MDERDKIELVRMYREGSTINKLGEYFGISKSTVHKILIANNIDIPKSNKQLIQEKWEQNFDTIVEMYKSGVPITKIEKAVGINYNTLRARLLKDSAISELYDEMTKNVNIEGILQDYDKLSSNEIVRKYNVPEYVYSAILSRNNLEPKRKYYNVDKDVIDSLNNGVSTREVLELYSIKYDTLLAIIHRNLDIINKDISDKLLKIKCRADTTEEEVIEKFKTADCMTFIRYIKSNNFIYNERVDSKLRKIAHSDSVCREKMDKLLKYQNHIVMHNIEKIKRYLIEGKKVEIIAKSLGVGTGRIEEIRNSLYNY